MTATEFREEWHADGKTVRVYRVDPNGNQHVDLTDQVYGGGIDLFNDELKVMRAKNLTVGSISEGASTQYPYETITIVFNVMNNNVCKDVLMKTEKWGSVTVEFYEQRCTIYRLRVPVDIRVSDG